MRVTTPLWMLIDILHVCCALLHWHIRLKLKLGILAVLGRSRSAPPAVACLPLPSPSLGLLMTLPYDVAISGGVCMKLCGWAAGQGKQGEHRGPRAVLEDTGGG